MKVIFIRHAGLKYPYNNYDRLSLEQLDTLATEKVHPSINTRVARATIKKHIEDGFLVKNKVDVIYYSPALRAQQTAQLLADTLTIQSSEERSYLQEIAFSPKKLASKDTFKKQGMHAVREALYEAIEHDRIDESHTALQKRVNQVKELITSDDERTAIIVTHGFFMRLLQIALLHNKSTYSAKNQRLAVNYGNLQGFIYNT